MLGRVLSGIGAIRADGRVRASSPASTRITKINYTYQIPLLIGITLRGRPGDHAKFHQSNGLYLEPVIAAIDMPFIPIERSKTILPRSPPPTATAG